LDKKINNILFINTGGGIGDALSCLPTINYINKYFSPERFYYYSTDLQNFWFEEKLSEFKPSNLITVKNFPEHFGFRYYHKKNARGLIGNFDFNKFDLIIDNQTRLKNTLIYKKIPHKNYITPCLNFLMSKPIKLVKKSKVFATRIIDYLNKVKGINDLPNYKINIPENFLKEAKKLINYNKKYIGFSITAGHQTRKKEIRIDEIMKVANYFSKEYVPTFFIEEKYVDLKKTIKKNVKNSYFPEENVGYIYKKPMMVTALGSLTKFNITIDNGISHMLSFSNNKNYIFYNNSSTKFMPLNNNSFIFDCSFKNTTIDKISKEEIINFISKNN
tara:strand:- start:1590 stop:2582 length:993 start_codon:yes stop_codon:yes gene_type:complete